MGPTVAIGEELGLVVNAKGAGKGKVSCVVVQPDGSEVEAEVLENEDGTFDIFYTAPAPGNYVIYVRFGGENIPRSPFKVMVRERRTADLIWDFQHFQMEISLYLALLQFDVRRVFYLVHGFIWFPLSSSRWFLFMSVQNHRSADS